LSRIAQKRYKAQKSLEGIETQTTPLLAGLKKYVTKHRNPWKGLKPLAEIVSLPPLASLQSTEIPGRD